jgi:hypothetical protein
MPLSKLLNDSEPMVIKQFDPKEGTLEVAEKVLSSCFLNLSPLPLVINIVLFIEYTPNPLFVERGL